MKSKNTGKDLQRIRGRELFATLSQFIRYVRASGIKNYGEWLLHCRQGMRPLKYPSNPDKFYPDWPGWTEALGPKGSKADLRSRYYTLSEFKRLVRSKGLTTVQEVLALRDGDSKIPSTPLEFYRLDVNSWGEVIGKGFKPPRKSAWSYISAQELVAFIRNEPGINSKLDYEKWVRSNWSIKRTYPLHPTRAYGKNWPGWRAVLLPKFDGRMRRSVQEIRPYSEFKEFIKRRGFKRRGDWESFCNSGGDRESFPRHPDVSYPATFEGWDKVLNINRKDNGI